MSAVKTPPRSRIAGRVVQSEEPAFLGLGRRPTGKDAVLPHLLREYEYTSKGRDAVGSVTRNAIIADLARRFKPSQVPGQETFGDGSPTNTFRAYPGQVSNAGIFNVVAQRVLYEFVERQPRGILRIPLATSSDHVVFNVSAGFSQLSKDSDIRNTKLNRQIQLPYERGQGIVQGVIAGAAKRMRPGRDLSGNIEGWMNATNKAAQSLSLAAQNGDLDATRTLAELECGLAVLRCLRDHQLNSDLGVDKDNIPANENDDFLDIEAEENVESGMRL